MAINMNQGQKVYTIKCRTGLNQQEFIDIPAAGQWDAEQQFKKQYPDYEIIGIHRKS